MFTASTTELGRELWVTDGSGPGTTLLLDIWPGPAPSDPEDFITTGGVVYFTARTPATGREVWRTDGTPSGTWMVGEVVSGTPDGSPEEGFTLSGGRVFFEADDGTSGREPWAFEQALVFEDDFESGDVDMWYGAVP